MLLIAALLVAAGPQEVLLTEHGQVGELCSALREYSPRQDADPAEQVQGQRDAESRRADALAKVYRVEVPSKGFAFGRYLAADNRLELDGDRPLKALDGALTLDVDGIDDVGFTATPSQVSQWSKDKKAGQLQLVVVFKPHAERCAGNPQSQSYRFAANATSWQLVGPQGVVAAADADGEPATAAAPHGARVDKVAFDTEPPAPDDGKDRLTGVESALAKCAAQAQRPGNVVVAFSAQGGHVRDPQVILDSVRDEKVARCIAQAIAGASVNGAGRGTASISLQ